jgi:hypothetical protein
MKNLVLERLSWLIHTNIQWLRQAVTLLKSISDAEYVTTLPTFAPQAVGGHLRHVLDFWECFLSVVTDVIANPVLIDVSPDHLLAGAILVDAWTSGLLVC